MKRFIGILFFISSAYAQGWGEQLLDRARLYSWPTNNPYLSAIWGSCQVPKPDFDKKRIKYKTRSVKSDSTYSGKIHYESAFHKDMRSRPTVFIVPGIFSKLGTSWTSRMPKLLSMRGYHAISFANPFSTSYVKERPKHRIMDVEAEAKSLYSAMRRIAKEQEERGLFNGEYRLLSMSYGAFISAVIVAMDSEHVDPLFKQDITLIAPPKNLWNAVLSLDALVESSLEDYEHRSYVRLYTRIIQLCFKDRYKQVTEEQAKRAKALVAQLAFKRPLLQVLRKYRKQRDDFYMPPLWQFLLYRHWKDELRFTDIFEQHLPDVRSWLQTEKGELMYWLEKARRQSGVNYRILTSNDDFLNHPGDFQASPHVLVLSRGGHLGYRSSQWLEDFLRLAFEL